MNNKPQLTAYLDKKGTERALKIFPIMILIGLFGLVVLSYATQFQNLPLLANIMKWMFYICIGFFSFISLFIYLLSKNTKPIAILNQQGIWIRYYNFIPWDNIEEFTTYLPNNLPIEAIGIRIKNIEQAANNSNRSGKFGLFCVKTFHQAYHINLSNLDVTNNDLMLFFHQHISKDHPFIKYSLPTVNDEAPEDFTELETKPILTTDPSAPKLFLRSDFFMFPAVSATCLYINLATKGPHEGFSSPLGLCFGLIGGGLIGLFFRQGWTYRQSIPGTPNVRLLKAQHSWNRLFREKKLFTGTEFLLLSAVVAGIFLADRITTGTYHNSLIINLILCLAMFAELLRRQYWKQ